MQIFTSYKLLHNNKNIINNAIPVTARLINRDDEFLKVFLLK